ncbi:unnamed protein product [Soboliphyme baturini]|uniref:Uncharacterized protein n=1 Tax=Soboliphyme baturini TaxID=241478 RepID=A0A183J344_9BILA|nr:unnamed protein product [Soboliphyme baturini]
MLKQRAVKGYIKRLLVVNRSYFSFNTSQVLSRTRAAFTYSNHVTCYRNFFLNRIRARKGTVEEKEKRSIVTIAAEPPAPALPDTVDGTVPYRRYCELPIARHFCVSFIPTDYCTLHTFVLILAMLTPPSHDLELPLPPSLHAVGCPSYGLSSPDENVRFAVFYLPSVQLFVCIR